jgi:hypothetical protein
MRLHIRIALTGASGSLGDSALQNKTAANRVKFYTIRSGLSEGVT